MISTKGRYALRVMLDLAQHAEDGTSPAPIIVRNLTKNLEYKMISNFSDYEIKMILNGGKINTIKAEA